MLDRMMTNGMKIDRAHFPKLINRLNDEMEVLLGKIAKFNGGKRINPRSSAQTAELLFKRLRMRPTKLTKGRKPSTQDKVLESIKGKHPVIVDVTDYRERAHLKENFAEVLPRFVGPDDRVRGSIKPATVVSGRLSMEDPNMMAIPTRTKLGKEIRRGFIAEDGCKIGACDLDQIEMRVMAHLSQDREMCSLFNDGRDIHTQTASDIFGVPLDAVDPLLHRYPAKRIGFGVLTGITGFGLVDQMHLAGIFKYSEEDCDGLIEEWFKKYKGVKTFLLACRSEAKSTGEARSMWGRLRYLPEVYSKDPAVYAAGLRESHSHVISATAQDLMKRGMKRFWDWLKANPVKPWKIGRNTSTFKAEPLLQIHDELIVEAPEANTEEVGAALIACLTADKLRVPVKAKCGWANNWAEVKD
jgi:DNA polymerase-1